MPVYNSPSFWNDSTPTAQKAHICAKACRFAAGGYDTNEFATFCQSIGCVSTQTIAQNGASPSAIIFTLAGGNVLVAVYGMGSYEQTFNAVVFSGAVANSRGPGLISALADAAYTPLKAAIVTALAGTSPAKTNIIYAGYSLGALVCALAAQDAITNFANTITVKNLYTFGAPRPGNQAFINTFANLDTVNILRRGDPIGQLPPHGDGIVLTDIVGGSANGRQRIVEYVSIPGETELTQTSLCLSRTPPSLTIIDAAIVALECAIGNDVPEEHKLGSYVELLANIAFNELRVQRRAHDEEKARLMGEWQSDQSETPPAELVTPEPSNDWPDPIVREPLPAAPSGHSYVRNFVRVLAVARNGSVTFNYGGGTEHAAKHDGKAHQAAHRILQDLALIRRHDWGVQQGTTKGKRAIVFDPAKLDQTIEDAIYQTEQYLLNNI